MGIVTFQCGWKSWDVRFRRGSEPKKVRERIENVGSGEGEGELSSDAEEYTVEVTPGGDCVHTPDDEGSLADVESASDNLAYKGGIGQIYL